MSVPIDLSLTQSLTAATTRTEMVDFLFDYMRQHGQSFYDESVTQLAHALQAAQLAKRAGAQAEQITAALLHDIGHFLMDEHSEHGGFLTDDWNHEAVGAEQMQPFFKDAVIEPIRLHVPAKRYLCTVDAEYHDGLSQASKRSFELQGGVMNEAEIAEFESNPFHQDAVLLRRWDDGAKFKGLEVADLETYRPEVEAMISLATS